MGIFDSFSKKKEQESVALPPPPMPVEAPEAPQEIAPISAPVPAEMAVEEPEVVHEKPIPREGPVFVSVQDYQEILNGVNSIKSKLGEVDDTFHKLTQIKSGQEKELEEWRKSLEDVQRKLTYVDEVLFGK